MQDLKKKQKICLDPPVLASANTDNKTNTSTATAVAGVASAPNTGINKTNSTPDLFVIVMALLVVTVCTILAIKKLGKKSKLIVAFIFSATGILGLLSTQSPAFANQPAIPADCQNIGTTEYEIAVKYINEQGEEIIEMVKATGTGKPDADYELVYSMTHKRTVEHNGQILETDLTIKSPKEDDELQVYEIVYRAAEPQPPAITDPVTPPIEDNPNEKIEDD